MKFPRWFSVGPFKPIKRPAFPVATELEARAQAIRIREKLGDPKSLRARARKPVDFDEGLPIG